MGSARFFFFGDSHIRALAAGSKYLRLAGVGRPIMQGRLWDEARFDIQPPGHLEIHDETGRQFLDESLAGAGVRTLFDLEMPIVTTAAFQVHLLLKAITDEYCTEYNPGEKPFLSSAFLRNIVLARRRKVFDLLESLHGPNRPVIAVSQPPRNSPVGLAVALESIIAAELENRGISTHLTRDWAAGDDGMLHPRFYPDKEGDMVHANALYGAMVLDRISPLLGLQRRQYDLYLNRMLGGEISKSLVAESTDFRPD